MSLFAAGASANASNPLLDAKALAPPIIDLTHSADAKDSHRSKRSRSQERTNKSNKKSHKKDEKDRDAGKKKKHKSKKNKKKSSSKERKRSVSSSSSSDDEQQQQQGEDEEMKGDSSRSMKKESKKHHKEERKSRKQAKRRSTLNALLASSSVAAAAIFAVDSTTTIATATPADSSMLIDHISSSSSDDDDDSAELSRALLAKSIETARKEAEADQAKIRAIEARLTANGGGIKSSHLATSSSMHATLPDPSDAFYLDTRGDQNLLLYESIYRYSIPSYYLSGGNRFLIGSDEMGLTKEDVQGILRRRGAGEVIVVKKKTRKHETVRKVRYWQERFQVSERDRMMKRFRLNANQDKKREGFHDGAEYIGLSPPIAASVLPFSAPSSSLLTPLSTVPLQLDEGVSFSDTTSSLTRLFTLALRQHPHDISLWLYYAQQQSSLLNPSRYVTSGEALWEKKAMIYEKGLMVNPGNEELQLALIHTAKWVWKSERVEALIKEACDQHPRSLPLWNTLLDWTCGLNGSIPFRFDAAVSSFEQAFDALRKQRQLVRSRHASGGSMYMMNASTMHQRALELQMELHSLNLSLLHIFLRYLRFLMHAGYTERALASWQVMIEWNTFRPRSFVHSAVLGLPLETLFQVFFESDAPRFGEEGARGFAEWIKQAEEGKPQVRFGETAKPQSAGKSSSPLSVEEWLQLEQQLTSSQWRSVPSASSTLPHESIPSSLHRVVLYEEIQSCIFDLASIEHESHRTPDSDAESCTLVQQLFFSGLEILFHVPSHALVPNGGWFGNSLNVMQNGVSVDCTADSSPSFAAQPEYHERFPCIGVSKIQDPFLTAFSFSREEGHVDDRQSIDVNKLSNTNMSSETSLLSIISSSDKLEFIRTCFKQMVERHSQSDSLKITSVSFEYAVAGVEARRQDADIASTSTFSSPFSLPRTLLKSYLQLSPSNLVLLQTYACCEYEHGFESQACMVLEKTLSLVGATPPQDVSVHLFWMYAQIKMRQAYAITDRSSPESATLIKHALHIMLSACEGAGLTPFDAAQNSIRPTRLVKARKMLNETIANTTKWIVSTNPNTVVSISAGAVYTAISLWVEYLTQGIEAVEKVWRQTIESASQPSPLLNASSIASLARPRSTFIIGDHQHEWLSTAYLLLLTAHRSRQQSYSPRLFRSAVLQVLETFQENSFFLSLLTESYRGAPSTGKLRRWFDEEMMKQSEGGMTKDDASIPQQSRGTTEDNMQITDLLSRAKQFRSSPPTPPSAVLTLHAINAELSKQGASARIVTLFEKSLMQSDVHATSTFSQALLLWRAYLRYEMCRHSSSLHPTQSEDATKIVYRMLQAIPCSKQIFVEVVMWMQEGKAISTTATSSSSFSSLSNSVLHEFFHSLRDRSLRFRVDLIPERDENTLLEEATQERPWERYARLEREKKEERKRVREEERKNRREERRSRHRRRHGRSRSRSRSRSGSDDDPRSDDTDSSSPSASSTRRSRSRSRSSSPSHRHKRSRRHNRSRSVSSSRERHRQRERAPLPVRPPSDEEEEGEARD